ncbi:hypothetical protein AB3X55_10680 [Alphaproteobacteria bacterium LSUCC0719]
MRSRKDEQQPDLSNDLSEFLSKGAQFAREKQSADELDRGEVEAAQYLALQERIKDQQSDRNLREKYANRLFWFLCIYNFVVLLLLVMQGFPSCPFQLPDIVLTTLVGSNAVAAIGLVSTVSRGLFKHR